MTKHPNMATTITPTSRSRTARRAAAHVDSDGRSRMIEAFYIAEARAYLAHQPGGAAVRGGSAR